MIFLLFNLLFHFVDTLFLVSKLFCEKIIAAENQPVRWTTPLGLPVVQPYRRLGRHLVRLWTYLSP